MWQQEPRVVFSLKLFVDCKIIAKIGGKLLQSRPEFIPSVMIVSPCTAGMYRVMVLGKRMKYWWNEILTLYVALPWKLE